MKKWERILMLNSKRSMNASKSLSSHLVLSNGESLLRWIQLKSNQLYYLYLTLILLMELNLLNLTKWKKFLLRLPRIYTMKSGFLPMAQIKIINIEIKAVEAKIEEIRGKITIIMQMNFLEACRMLAISLKLKLKSLTGLNLKMNPILVNFPKIFRISFKNLAMLLVLL